MNGCLLWSLAVVCTEPCDYLRWALRPFVMSLAVVCDEPCGRLCRALRLFAMGLAAICNEPCGYLRWNARHQKKEEIAP